MDFCHYQTVAEEEKDRLNSNRLKGESYHVRKFDLASIDLAELMGEG